MDDHDLLIRISENVEYLRKAVDDINARLDKHAETIEEHDRWINRLKGAAAATGIFLTVFGATLLYFILG